MDDNPIRIVIEHEDGTIVERNVGGIFEADGNTYAFLTSEQTTVNGEVEFIRLDPVIDKNDNEVNDFIISPISTQKEYNVVISAFNDYINDALYYDNEERITVDFTSDDGIVTCELLDIFGLNMRNYAALYYEEKNTIDFMRVETINGNSPDMYSFTSITSELEYDRVKEYYCDKYINKDNNE